MPDAHGAPPSGGIWPLAGFLSQPDLLWLEVLGDTMIAVAFITLPVTALIHMVRRHTVPSSRLLLVVGGFVVVMAATHLIEILTTWSGAVALEGAAKILAGTAALATAVVLIPLVPRALAMRSRREVARMRRQRAAENRERRRAQDELRRARDELQDRVKERTAALSAANRRLQWEVRERERAERRMQHLAHHDALTGLPNRVLLQDRLRQALLHAWREQRRVAVMLLDLDHFKHVNDTLGHPAGDALLRRVAERIAATLRASDTLARLGGDEFAVIQTELQDLAGAATLAQKLLDVLTQPFEVDGHEIHSGTSIGITVFPDDGEDPDQLLTNADMALYRAKADSRASYQFFAADMIREATARKDLERDLRRAIRQEELALFFQPQVDLRTERVLGTEALIRWNRPDRGLVGPATFVPVAERTGLIQPLGEWVLHTACEELRRLRDLGHDLTMTVNLSAAQLKRQDMVRLIASVLDESGVTPQALDLEITETMLVEHKDVVTQLFRLADLGCGIVIDDFGTGYSSLAYLQRFPVKKIKVDKSFVFGIGTDPEAEAIVHTIIRLAHSLGKRVTAEGAEREAQLDFLRDACCDEVQGFIYGKPMAAAGLHAILSLHHGFARPGHARPAPADGHGTPLAAGADA